jgi:DNA-binding Lrp family transcriptional regulator
MKSIAQSYGEYATMTFMDELDEVILAHLQRDGRQTNRELARAVGVAPSTCLERVRALRQRGVITGFHAHVSLAGLNRSFQALIAVQARPLSRQVITDFKDWVTTLPEVLALFVLTGNDDFLLHVAVRDVEHLHAFLMDKFSKRREIVSFRTSVIYQHTRNTVLAPFDERP